MSWLLFSLAVALTPDELAAAMPAAQETVQRCAAEGCARADGANAAFVLAVGTYVSEGRADGGLAATVRALDTDLFGSLPDVVQAAATTPEVWAERVGGVEQPRDELSKSEVRLRRLDRILDSWYSTRQNIGLPDTDVTIQVVDTSGAAVQRAFVRFPMEDARLEANTTLGTWMGSLLYLDDGKEVFFRKGDTLRFEVFAPGFAARQVRYVIPRKRKNVVQVVLEPAEFVLASGAPPVAERAHRSYQDWLEADAAYVREPNEANSKSAASHARDAVDAARTWLDATPSQDALQMCRMVGSIDECGPL